MRKEPTMKKLAGKRKRQVFGSGKENENFDPDVVVKLYELLQGEREMIRIFSKSLGCEICFVNAELTNPMQLAIDCPVYTTEELAFILTLTEAEFKQFHYLKTRQTD